MTVASFPSPPPLAEYRQYPQPFELAESVVASGVSFTGCRARVYHLLRETRERAYRHKIGRHLGPAGWVPKFLFREPWAGGEQGSRRMRELREYGVVLEFEDFDPPDGQGSSTTIWRMARDPLAAGTTSSPSPLPCRHTPTPEHKAPHPTTAQSHSTGRTLRFTVRETEPQARLGCNQSAGAVSIDPGSKHPLAVPEMIPAALKSGLYDADDAAEEYRERLRDLWRTGELARQAERDAALAPTVVYSASRRGDFSPLEILTKALVAAGGVLVSATPWAADQKGPARG